MTRLMTRHPRYDEWADLSRGLLALPVARRLRDHAARCASCRRTLHAYERVAAVGHGDAALSPPAEAVARAVGIMPSRRPARVLSGRLSSWPRLAASLVLDSWAQPAMAGVRSLAVADRHLTYRSGGWEVDLRLEGGDGKVTAITGQVTQGDAGAGHWDGVPVLLVAGRRTVAMTMLNAFGEFQLECDARVRNLRLSIPFSSTRERLDIPVHVGGGADLPTHALSRGRS